MKNFVRHLYKFQFIDITSNGYTSLLHDIHNNYMNNHIGPIPKIHTNITLPIVKKTVKNIDIYVENLYDLIQLIDNNPFEPQYEYNIDLEALHRIRGELCLINDMIGLTSLKQSLLDQLFYFLQNLHKGGEGDFKHTVLMGPPGTGKTEVAKIIGIMYSKLGVLSNNVFKKVTRSDLIAGYLGQTAIKTQKLIESCLGGVLFIDEAYSLGDTTQSDIFSKECIDTLCESLSNHKDNLMVIIAGYDDALKQCFFNMNQGLESRFLWRFQMDPYSPKELQEIFIKKVGENGWSIENQPPIHWFETKKENFQHYGRDIEGLFTYSKIAHGRRIYGKSSEKRKCLNLYDMDKGFQAFLKHKEVKKSFLCDMYI
jgi:hypothetical protein